MMKSLEMTMVIGAILALLGLGVLGGPVDLDSRPLPSGEPTTGHGLAWND